MAFTKQLSAAIRLGDFTGVLDEAIAQLATRIEVYRRKQLELENSLMGLKELRASISELPEAATRAIVDAVLRQVGLSPQQRNEAMHGMKGPAEVDDEDGPACAESLSPDESLTNFQKIVRFFVERKNKPATNQEIRSVVGASRGAVAQVLYTTHPDKFERLKARISGKVAWRLSDDVYKKEELAIWVDDATPDPEPDPDAAEEVVGFGGGQEEDIPF